MNDGQNFQSGDEKNDIPTHHIHPTVLVAIPHFNIVCNIPLEYMHLVCYRTMKLLLGR